MTRYQFEWEGSEVGYLFSVCLLQNNITSISMDKALPRVNLSEKWKTSHPLHKTFRELKGRFVSLTPATISLSARGTATWRMKALPRARDSRREGTTLACGRQLPVPQKLTWPPVKIEMIICRRRETRCIMVAQSAALVHLSALSAPAPVKRLSNYFELLSSHNGFRGIIKLNASSPGPPAPLLLVLIMSLIRHTLGYVILCPPWWTRVFFFSSCNIYK